MKKKIRIKSNNKSGKNKLNNTVAENENENLNKSTDFLLKEEQSTTSTVYDVDSFDKIKETKSGLILSWKKDGTEFGFTTNNTNGIIEISKHQKRKISENISFTFNQFNNLFEDFIKMKKKKK